MLILANIAELLKQEQVIHLLCVSGSKSFLNFLFISFRAQFTNVTKQIGMLHLHDVGKFICDVTTAPQGQNITQIITTPTFVTLLFEQTPAATKWELEYNNTATGVVTTQTVPDDAISNTSYVAM